VVPNDRVWLRDSGPTGVMNDDGSITLVNWAFNAWAKYPNYEHDAQVGAAVEKITGLHRVEPKRPDNGERVVLEGGGIETDGEGTLLVTEEWLLSNVQVRNPGLTRADYEYMAFPRLAALAEVGWTPSTLIDWESFRRRIGQQGARLAAMGVNFARVPGVNWAW